MLPLELWLKNRASKPTGRFPTDADYFALYSLQKDKFKEHIYPYVGAGILTFEDGTGRQMYTDHGIQHIEAVISVAGKLLGCRNANSKIGLEPYEVYLLLMCILSHDAGNIEGRQGHEIKVARLLKHDLTKVISESAEISDIHEIARAHTAKGLISGLKEKDTISKLKATHSRLGITFRKRAIAAILRLSDEVCEDQSRIPRVALDNDAIKSGPSAPHLFYGKSIASVTIDPSGSSIDIRFEIEENLIFNPILYVDASGTHQNVYIVQEILNRLGKLKLEWIYCSRYLRNIVEIETITASIVVAIDNEIEDTQELVDIVTMNLSDVGYPAEGNTLVTTYPVVDVENLKINVNLEKEKRR